MKADEVIEKIAGLCEKYSADRAVLFGSRAKGTALERSDIDIAVSGVKEFSAMEELENLKNFASGWRVSLDQMKIDVRNPVDSYGGQW